MQTLPASAQDESNIKALLDICKLPTDDINASHMKNFFVIQDAGKIAGCVGLEVCGEFGLLRSLALSESLRRQGLGVQLIQHIEGHARSQQIRSLYLLTTTADRFFARNGYQAMPRESAPAPIQETTEFQSTCPASAVCLFKELD